MVLPAYNEEADLPGLLENLENVFAILARKGFDREYVIVDDGSQDATGQIIRDHQQRLPITVITHNPNLGLGITIRDGLQKAAQLSCDNDIILAMDSDNTHPSGLMIRMVQMILEGNDVVIASRYRTGSRVVGLSWFRKCLSTGARILFQLTFPIRGVRDYTCGYRAYKASVIKQAFQRYGDNFVEYSGFQSMADILLKISRLNVTINEVPMILRYDRKGGASKMQVGETVINTLKLLFKRRFSGFGIKKLEEPLQPKEA